MRARRVRPSSAFCKAVNAVISTSVFVQLQLSFSHVLHVNLGRDMNVRGIQR